VEGQEKLLDAMKRSLDWGSLQFDPADNDGVRALSLPTGGVAIRDLAVFAEAISSGTGLVDFLDPKKMGPSERSFTAVAHSDAPRKGLYLTRFEINSANGDDDSYVLNLEWQGTTWELIPDLLSIHEPGVTLGMTPGNNGTPEELRGRKRGRGSFLRQVEMAGFGR